ncbi:hypothetical protein BV22DRAFT_424523 [Leucogyrophana mollusca]|uniref:Uncharacterized protein n=1 Tax=Leucogyrophana mollusca TaxID=85980 RepID=A0ACB8BJD5_9AGAM|nr:hypothetical protein BV22DRAFT_424523 [Leucogyrophana mollusca]
MMQHSFLTSYYWGLARSGEKPVARSTRPQAQMHRTRRLRVTPMTVTARIGGNLNNNSKLFAHSPALILGGVFLAFQSTLISSGGIIRHAKHKRILHNLNLW